MNISKEILDMTIEEVMDDEELAIETRNHIKNILESNDKEKITKTILGHIYVFSKYSIIKDIYNNDLFIDEVINKMKTGNFREIENFFVKINKSIDISVFINQQKIIDFLLNSNAIDYLGRIDGFFDFFNGSLKKQLVYKYLSFKELNIFILDYVLPEDMIDEILSNSKYYEEIKKSIVSRNGGVSIFNEYKSKKVWEYYKDIIAILSLSDKIDYFRGIHSETLKETVFKELNFEEEIDNISSIYLECFIPYLTQEFIYNKCMTKDVNIINKYIKYLDFENQKSAVIKLTNERVRLTEYFEKLSKDVKQFVFLESPKLLYDYQIYNLYLETNNLECLIYLKNKFIKTKEVCGDVLYEDSFVNILTDEEKQLIIEILPEKIFYYPRKTLKFNDYFFKIMKEKYIEYLKNNSANKGHIYFDNLKDYYTTEEQLQIIKYIDSSWLPDILSSKENYDWFINLLKIEPSLLKGLDINNCTISYITNELIDKIEELIPFFEESQLTLFFTNGIISSNEYVHDLFIEKVKENPDLLNSLYSLRYFEKEEQIEILSKMSINKLHNIIHYSRKEDDILSQVLNLRLDEYIDYLNRPGILSIFHKDIETLYINLDNDRKVYLLSKITSLKSIEELFLGLEKEEESAKIVLDELVFNRRKNIINDKYNFRLISYNRKYIQYLIDNLDMANLMYISTYYYNKDIISKCMNYIKEDNKILINEDLFSFFNIFMSKLSIEDKDYINNIIDDFIDNNDLFNNEYKDKLGNIDTLQKLVFLNLYDKKILEGDKKILFDKLLNNNKFILNSIHSVMFDENMSKLPMSFIDKVSRYPLMQEDILKLKNKNYDMLKFISNVGIYLSKNDINPIAYDKEMSMIIEYLVSNKNVLNNFDFSLVNENNIEDVINFIMYEYEKLIIVYNPKAEVYQNINEMYSFKIDNFTNERLLKCDEAYKNCTNINDKKNIFFNKYLSMTLYDARNFYKTYIINYHKVIGYASSDLPIKYIEIINKIINIEDSEVLDQLYESDFIYFDMTDRLTIESIMQEAYFKSLSNDYVDKQNGTDIVKGIKDKDGNLVSLKMTELLDDFGIILHSTDAYGSMELIDNDYFISWNDNSNTENHGICCSYITNSSYGTAPVYANGVMFGFTKINDTSITAYSPYDLATSNSGFNITCRYVPHFTLLDDIPDYTRHTHNEFNLERRNNSIEPRYPLVQPDSIIIFEDMDESIKANSIKAYNDFKAHGIELKIYYIDRVKVANNEANKIKYMIEKFIDTFDLNILRDIINKYESNICGCDFIGNTFNHSLNLINQHELFYTNSIKKLLNEVVDYLMKMEDINVRNNLIMEFIDILESEQYKFDLLDDMNKDRAHKFELYDDELKNKVQVLSSYLTKDVNIGTYNK